jgi:DNA-binding SARP family transcriptional activator/tetratricopeptide (TPR) repeat protein
MTCVETLAVRMLGDFDVEGVDLHRAGSRKARTLLWLLALGRGSSVPSDAIVECLWADAPPQHTSDQVAVLVSRLRTVIGRERIEHVDGGYRLHYDWMDVNEVESLMQEMDRRQAEGDPARSAAAARVAISLIRTGTVPMDPCGLWAATEVGALERLIARCRHIAGVALLSAGAWLEAVDAAAASLASDPYDEAALRLLMRAHAAGGRTAAAIAVFASSARRLVEDLGTDPSPETMALHSALLRGELSVEPALSARLGGPQGPLVGRDQDLARLDAAAERAAESTIQVVLVRGEAGIGKTSLVRTWASRRSPTDIVLFGSCGQPGWTAPLDPILVPLRESLRAMGDERTTEVLGADATILAPLMGLAPASSTPLVLADGTVGPSLLFGALANVVSRLTESGVVILILDDAHLGGPALSQWIEFIRRRTLPLMVLATVRTAVPVPIGGAEEVTLGPLDYEYARQLVGVARADALYARSGGHPLFLTELARATSPDGLPESLVESVSARCDSLGRAGDTLRNAAVIGNLVDPELIATVLNRPAVEILDDAELGVRHGLLLDDAGVFRFRHSLVRDALSTRVGAARSAWLNRQVARALARRPGSDPEQIAEHARRGGDVDLAAASLRAASARAEERFDHATAESLLDDAIALHPQPELWLDRARVRMRRGDYAAAYLDVDRALPLGAVAHEVGAWASYFDRRFDQAADFATDGAAIADDPAVRARCLTVAGRTRHAAGDLAVAEALLVQGIDDSRGSDRMIASAWLGVLRSHQSRSDDALALLRPVTRPHVGAAHSSAVLHALLFSGHAHALAGRAALSLDAFDQCDAEVERRQVLRFIGRGTNFAGWVLRNLGAAEEAAERHTQARETGLDQGLPELFVAACEDLAEHRMAAGDLDAAAAHLAEAAAALRGDLVFGWRLRFKLDLLRARLALASSDTIEALRISSSLADAAGTRGVPRYATVARLLVHRSRAHLGEPVDLDSVEQDLAQATRAVAIEAWWWMGESAAAHRVPAWVDRAADQMVSIARQSGARGPALLAAGAPRLEAWKAAAEE